MFRADTIDNSHNFRIKGLHAEALYKFTDVYSGESFEVRGATAMTDGIEVGLERMSSKVLHVTEIERMTDVQRATRSHGWAHNSGQYVPD